MTIEHSAWAGMVPVDDTALYVTDTRGPGRPVVYLNGAYADRPAILPIEPSTNLCNCTKRLPRATTRHEFGSSICPRAVAD
jgi:hypothetical protein